jgi:hypothetical protein
MDGGAERIAVSSGYNAVDKIDVQSQNQHGCQGCAKSTLPATGRIDREGGR